VSLGPVMLDLEGTELAREERDILRHPLVGGVILFSRNYASTEQLATLVDTLHKLREPRLLVAVDHEGGRVQRFRSGFTALPACAVYGMQYDRDKHRGRQLAEHAGWLMASELRALGIDFSFAPVLDLNKGISKVIGDRSFHRNPDCVADLAKHYMQGMHRTGMSSVGKHFPGHGSVAEDSHLAIPIDNRRYEDIQMEDLIPFERLIDAGLAAIMPAHVIYPEVDDKPAGFSSVWLKEILRRRLRFQGTIFSDDIDMAGAEFAGDFPARAREALVAGCDMVLVCNNREGALDVLDRIQHNPDPATQVRLMRMHGKKHMSLNELSRNDEWKKISTEIADLDVTPELDLGDDAV